MASRLLKYAVLCSIASLSMSAGAAFAQSATPAKPAPDSRSEPAISPLLFPLVDFDKPVVRAVRPTTRKEAFEAQSKPCPAPAYPDGAKSRGEQGVTRIGYNIDGDGWVVSTKIVKSSGYAVLDEAALSTIGGCWFQPVSDRSPVYAEQDYVWKLEIQKAAVAAGASK